MSILSKGTTFSTGDQVTAANLNALVDSATFATGAVDDTTTALDSSSPKKIIVKNLGIAAAQLASDAVTTVKILDSSSKTTGVTLAKMQHISTAKILGRTTASDGNVEEIDIVIGGSGDAGVLFDNDDMLDNSDTAGGSATRGATQQSIKAYVDASSTDGFVPTSYTGGETITFPNGLIMKFGTATISSNTTTAINFAANFPNATVSAQLTLEENNTTDRFAPKIESLSTSTLTVRETTGGGAGSCTVHWQVIGR